MMLCCGESICCREMPDRLLPGVSLRFWDDILPKVL